MMSVVLGNGLVQGGRVDVHGEGARCRSKQKDEVLWALGTNWQRCRRSCELGPKPIVKSWVLGNSDWYIDSS